MTVASEITALRAQLTSAAAGNKGWETPAVIALESILAGLLTTVGEIDTAQSAVLIGPEIMVFAPGTNVTTGDSAAVWCVPASANGKVLQSAHAFVVTASTSGLPTVQIHNITKSNADMLTTRITIDANEFTSYTAAAAPVVDAAHNLVNTGDLLSIDVDVAGTGTKGLGVILVFAPA